MSLELQPRCTYNLVATSERFACVERAGGEPTRRACSLDCLCSPKLLVFTVLSIRPCQLPVRSTILG